MYREVTEGRDWVLEMVNTEIEVGDVSGRFYIRGDRKLVISPRSILTDPHTTYFQVTYHVRGEDDPSIGSIPGEGDGEDGAYDIEVSQIEALEFESILLREV